MTIAETHGSPQPKQKKAMFPNPNLVKDVKPMRDDPLTTDLVTRAGSGDKQAWDALVERYAPLVWSICRRHQLGTADADDVGQTVWLQLVDHLDRVRDPAALPGWLATTTRRECGRFLRTARRSHATRYVPDVENIPDAQAKTAEQELLAAERHAALREAFGDLPLFSQQLIALLIQDPPVQYAEISARLGIAVGSIGPHRGRCLEKLRRHPAIAALINADTSATADYGPAAAVDRRGAAAGLALTASGAAEPTARWSSVDAEKPIPLPRCVADIASEREENAMEESPWRLIV